MRKAIGSSGDGVKSKPSVCLCRCAQCMGRDLAMQMAIDGKCAGSPHCCGDQCSRTKGDSL